MPSRYFWQCAAQNFKCPRRLWEIDLDILHTYLMCPCRAFCEWKRFYFCFFSLEIWDLQRPKSPTKHKTPIDGEKKKRKKPFRERLGRGTSNTCANNIIRRINIIRYTMWGLVSVRSLCHSNKNECVYSPYPRIQKPHSLVFRKFKKEVTSRRGKRAHFWS